MDCPDRMLTMEKVLKMLLYVLPRSVMERIFDLFIYGLNMCLKI